MGQWEDKLGAILNDPQAMSQIMSLAQSLGGQNGEASSPAPSAEPAPEPQTEPAQAETPVGAPLPGLDLDPKLMEAGMRALSVWNDPEDPRANLLQALRPFLKEERQTKLDKAIRVARLSKAVRAALEGLQGGVRADV